MNETLTLLAAAKPAGGAAIDQVIIATAGATVATAALLALITYHRRREGTWLGRAAALSERVSGLPGWAALPSGIGAVSLITAVVGMYWDIALHIADGRDEGPLANPAHYLILAGLFGIFAAGCIAVALPARERPGPAAVKIGPLHAPVGGVLMAAAGAFALLGFPLDDMWHRLFGQDVTLWGPTHLMLIGGAGLTLIGQAVLLAEGMHARKREGADVAPAGRRDLGKAVTYLRRMGVMGGLLIGLSTFQAEFDFGVPQFGLVFQPVLIAFAAGVALVAARIWMGPGGAIGAAVFFLAIRGVVSLLVGPVLGEPTPALPLYLAEAACVELLALALARRPMALAVAGGVAIGTVGYAAEHAWSQLVMPVPWTGELLPEGVVFAIVAGVAGGVIGALLALGLRRELPGRAVARPAFALALLAIAIVMVNGLVTRDPEGVSATVALTDTQGPPTREARADVRLSPPSAGEDAKWVQLISWQGGGLRVDQLERVGQGAYRSTEPMPLYGEWKTVLRLHRGREVAGVPVFLPEDPAIPAEGVSAPARFERGFVDETKILQRELKDDVPGWLWPAAGLFVLLCALGFIGALAWGVGRLSSSTRPGGTPPAKRPARAPRATPQPQT